MRGIPQNLISSIFTSLAIFLIGYWALPGYYSVSSLYEDLNNKKEELRIKNDITESLNSSILKYNEKLSDIGRLGLLVPSGGGLPEIVSAIENIGSRNGILIRNLKTAQSNTGDRSNDRGDANDQIGKTQISIEVAGSYLSIINFLDDIEKNIRILDVTKVDIPGLESSASSLLSAKLELQAYFIR